MTPAYEGWTCQAQVSGSGSAVPTARQGAAPLRPLPALTPVAQPGAAGVWIIRKKQRQQREHGLPLKASSLPLGRGTRHLSDMASPPRGPLPGILLVGGCGADVARGLSCSFIR